MGQPDMTRSRALPAYVGLYILFLYLPVALIPLFSFNDSVQAAFPLKGGTLEWYRTLLATPAITTALMNSIVIALTAATIATLCATTIAYLDVFPRPRTSRLISGLARLPILIPGVIVGISLLILVNLAGLGPSRPAIVMGHVLICLPAAVTVLRARFAAIPKSIAEVASDLGASDFTVFRRAILPLAWSAVGSAFTLSFLTSFDEFIVAFFLAGTDQTLPLYIWSQLRFPKSLPVVMALGTLILLTSVILAAIAEILRRQTRF
ncbi:MAG: ABC transporter permease [Cereibacter sphaeroides]|uniref:ABC transporter permease n=1 Tax=Cereibacter sphaeroides TaxID=1063 RepID=A0A2W5S6F2_CERSP|nr:MAG: ABC transporter permease [Cereibacter sphaeroides]